MKNYGQLIAKLRKEKGLTQEQLGKQLNVSYQAVSKWENNLSEPDLETIEKLSEIFGISLTEFFGMASNQNKTQNINLEKENVKSIKKSNIFNTIKTKPWYLAIILGICIIILSFCAFFTPNKYSSSKIYSMVDPAVFCITAQNDVVQQAGSGFFINNKGLAVTNYHVIKDCTSGKIQLNNGKVYNIKSLVGCDEKKDIAIIQIDIKKSPVAKLGDSNKISVGDVVYAIGYPESFVLGSADSTFTQGIISKISYVYQGNTYIQTTVDMTRGNSGGALINEQGKVIGITSAMLTDGQINYMNMAIPINKINDVERNINSTLERYHTRHKIFTFCSDGQTIYTQNFIRGEKVTRIDDPEKTGYAFDDWYTDTTFSEKFDFDQPVEDSTSCYAKWIPNKYIIRFNSNGASGTMDDIIATYDVWVALPQLAFLNEHYEFKGWQIEGKSDLIADCQNVLNLSEINNDLIVLTAVWEIENYTIQFDGNNADSGQMDSITLNYDQIVTLPKNQYSKNGYLFNGWLYNNNIYQDEEEISKLLGTKGTIVLTAQWNPIKYKIIFAFDGLTSYEQEFTYDKAENLISNQFTKEFYHFNYWTESITNKIYYDESQILNLSNQNDAVLIFNACFSENYYTLRYNPDKNVDLENSFTQRILYSQEGTISAPISSFSKLGYDFTNWISDDNKVYQIGDTFLKLSPLNGDIIDLFACWEEIKYTVCYKYPLKTGVKYTNIGIKSYEEEFVIIEPEYVDDGYEFSFYNVYYTYTFYPGDTAKRLATSNNDTIYITAQYTPKNYTIKFNGNGATSGTMEDVIATFDEPVSILENQYSKNGYTFKGWEYNGQEYLTTDLGVLITEYQEEVVLNAIWIKDLNGEGTIDNPYKISTLQDLQKFKILADIHHYKNKYVSLLNDIDCEFNKIESVDFEGFFDGQNHKLINVDYANGKLFNSNLNLIKNLGIENIKIEITNTDSTKAINISGLVYHNSGLISNCYVKGTIDITTNSNIQFFGLTGTNGQSGLYNIGYVQYCYTDLQINILATENIDYCLVYGIGVNSEYLYQNEKNYNYSIIKLNAEFKDVSSLKVTIFSNVSESSFAEVNYNIQAENVEWYDFAQTVAYYSDNSEIKVYIGGKSVPKLVETKTEESNLKNKLWMEENLFTQPNSWIYDGINYPVPSTSINAILINSQEEFIALSNRNLYSNYILNCDIDLSGYPFFNIQANYGVFDGNGHKILNYAPKENENVKIYEHGLFIQNFGIIKNLSVENLNIEIYYNHDVKCAGIVIENFGTINSCCVKGVIKSNWKSSIVGGIAAISHGGKIINCYTDCELDVCTTENAYSEKMSDMYVGGILAMGDGYIESCYVKNYVKAKAHYAQGNIVSVYGISGGTGLVKNCFIFSDVTITQYKSQGFEYIIGAYSVEYENCFAYEWQSVTKLSETVSTGDVSFEELCSEQFLQNLNFEKFVSIDNLEINQCAVWIITEEDLPTLWFEN